MVLLVAAGLLIQGLRRLQNADRGFSPDNVTVMQVRGSGSQATQPIASLEYQHYVDHLAAIGGVEAAAVDDGAAAAPEQGGVHRSRDGRAIRPTLRGSSRAIRS